MRPSCLAHPRAAQGNGRARVVAGVAMRYTRNAPEWRRRQNPRISNDARAVGVLACGGRGESVFLADVQKPRLPMDQLLAPLRSHKNRGAS